MDPKNYQNFTRNNLCCLLPRENVLKLNPNSTVNLIPNLTGSFSTLWIFFGDASFCKHRTWQLVRNLLNFFITASTYDIMTSWQISWFSDFVCFFFNFKTIRPHVRGRVSWIRFFKFLFTSQVWPQTRLNNMNIIFLLIFFLVFESLAVQIWLDSKNYLKCN
jgi:hypothetical protein